jgi:hypothetical protein
MPFSDIAGMLDTAKLSFAASANLLEHVDNINLTAEGRKLLGEITHPTLHQSVRDYLVNQQFRKDVWVKGARSLPAIEQRRLLGAQRFVLTTLPADIPMVVYGSLGAINLLAEVCQPVIEVLAREKLRPKTLDEIQEALPKHTHTQIREALILLSGAGHAHPAQPEKAVRAVKPRTNALNGALMRRAQASGDSTTLASPVIGAGISVNRLQQMFLAEIANGRKTPEDWAAGTWAALDAQGQRVIKDGKLLEGKEANVADLVRQATEFAEKRLPVLTALQVV